MRNEVAIDRRLPFCYIWTLSGSLKIKQKQGGDMKNLFVVVPALMCCFVCACAFSRKQADDSTSAEAFAVEFENADQAKLLADLPIGDSSGLENWSGLFIDGLPQIGGACTDERRATLRIPILPAGRHCVQDSFAVPMELYVPVYD